MPHTPDWQALTLARLTNTEPDMVDTTDPAAWLLAYATLGAHQGEVDPPEVLAELVQRVDGLERSQGMMAKTNNMIFESINNQLRRITEALTIGKRRGPRDTVGKPTPDRPSYPVSDLFAPPSRAKCVPVPVYPNDEDTPEAGT